MPLPQKKLIPGILLLMMLAAIAAPPLWWSTGNPPVITGAAKNNKGPANIGQAKHMTKSALDALRPILPVVTAQIESDLSPFVDFSIPDPKSPEWLEKQKAPLLIGQLKIISHHFYDRLHVVAPTWLEAQRIANGTNHPGSIFPWTTDSSDDNNKGVANIGQLKAVFSLHFETLANFDYDQDGLPDMWEIANGFSPTSSGDALLDPDGDGITNIQERQLGLDPNHFNPNGPTNLGFRQALNPGDIVTTFRDPTPPIPPNFPDPYDPQSSEFHPSDLYLQGGLTGWESAIGEFIEVWNKA